MIDFRQILTTSAPSPAARLLRCCLRVASVPYGLAIRLRNLAFDHGWKKSTQASLPVISIGNLSVGGTGKSPMVAWLARWFRARSIRVAILSRGYGQLDGGQNDEALELELQLPDVPHLQHWDRIASAKLAADELDMQVLLLDDGFQHRRLARNLEIVLLDATEPRSAQWLLPGGLKREPISSLRRADIIVLTRSDQVSQDDLNRLSERVGRIAPRAKVLTACHRPAELCLGGVDQAMVTRSVSELNGKQVLAFCAIGNPASFFRSLTDLGANILDQRLWRDHHVFTADDITSLADWTTQYPAAELAICTMKDWVKIQQPRLGRTELAALSINMQLSSGQDSLEQALEEIVSIYAD